MGSKAVSTFLGLILIASAASAEVISGVAAIVNDEIITSLELSRECSLALQAAEKRGMVSPDSSAKRRSEVLDSLIARKLIRQKIKELNVVIPEEEVRQSIEDVKRQNKLSQEALVAALLSQGMTFDQYKEQMKDQLERLRLMSQEVKSKVQVTEKELKDYYAANLASFSEEDTYRARAIFLRLDADAAPKEIRAVMVKLETALAAVKKGGDFAEHAKKYSDDANVHKDGGDLGFFKKGEMLPEIEKIVLSIKSGEIDMIAAPGGFYIIKLEEKRSGTAKQFEAVKAQIEETLYQKKSEERFASWLEVLRKEAAIEIRQ